MKMILQKHTSKFVAGLFNSLGITACVSLTSCGGENKGKHTENQVEKLKNGLMSKGLDEEDAQVIVDWLNSNGKDSAYELTGKDLQEIFKNNPDRLNEVAETLGVELTESDAEPDDEKKKEIQKWVTKLASLKDAEFDKLDDGLKGKVAKKFIDNNIDITKDSDIQTKLAGFINEVKEEKKQNEISIKVVGEGKVTITNVFDKKTTEFVFNTFEVFEKFVDALNGKEITDVEGELSFAFTGKNVKIGGHGTGFDITEYAVDFFKCFEDLIKIEGLNLNVSDLSLTYTGEKLSLNGVDLSSKEYFKGKEFWTLVKDHAAFFGITDEKKLKIEKNGVNGDATVKIENFESSLKWSDVVAEGDEAFVANSGWDKIFQLKSKEESVENVTVEFDAGKCTCKEIEDYKNGVELNSLEALEKLVGVLKKKTVKIGENKIFSLAFDNKTVKVCGHSGGFEVMKDTNFATLLGHVKSLKEVGVIDRSFQIKIAVADDDIKLGEGKIYRDFMKTQNFWDAVKTYKELFGDLGSKKIEVSKVESGKRVKIGNTELDFDVLAENNGDIHTDWNGIFKV